MSFPLGQECAGCSWFIVCCDGGGGGGGDRAKVRLSQGVSIQFYSRPDQDMMAWLCGLIRPEKEE